MKKYLIMTVVYTIIFIIILAVMWRFLLDESVFDVLRNL